MNKENISCAFFGHRDATLTSAECNILQRTIENLVTKYNVLNFLFGSKSKFDDICYDIVSNLKKKYPNIKCIAYVCKHECACLYNEVETQKNIAKNVTGLDIKYKGFDKIEECFNKIYNGKNAYIYRNQQMINASKYIIVYFKDNYSIKTNSGTKIALTYAKQKNKNIIYI